MVPVFLKRLICGRELRALQDLNSEVSALSDEHSALQKQVVALLTDKVQLLRTLRQAQDMAKNAEAQANAIIAANYRLRREHELTSTYNPSGAWGSHICCPCVDDIIANSAKAIRETELDQGQVKRLLTPPPHKFAEPEPKDDLTDALALAKVADAIAYYGIGHACDDYCDHEPVTPNALRVIPETSEVIQSGAMTMESMNAALTTVTEE